MIQVRRVDVDELLAQAITGERHVHVVEGGPDRERSIDAFAAALGFPDHFGRNLDALMDSLRDVADRHDDPWVLLWCPHGIADADAGDDRAAADKGVLAVLQDLDDEYPELTVAVGGGLPE